MTTMYALNEEDYRCLRENIKELFTAAKDFGALNPTSNAVCELDQGHRARTTAM